MSLACSTTCLGEATCNHIIECDFHFWKFLPFSIPRPMKHGSRKWLKPMSKQRWHIINLLFLKAFQFTGGPWDER